MVVIRHAPAAGARYAVAMETDPAADVAAPAAPMFRPPRPDAEAEADCEEAASASWRQPRPPLRTSDAARLPDVADDGLREIPVDPETMAQLKALVYDTASPDPVGPVLATTPGTVTPDLRRAPAAAGALCAGAALAWAAEVPGQDAPAIRTLLDAGFRPRTLLPWFADGPIGQWDRYILRSEELL